MYVYEWERAEQCDMRAAKKGVEMMGSNRGAEQDEDRGKQRSRSKCA